jgi:formamidopyrimidine-DNA glycosylase
MPELPEVEITRRGIMPAILGRRIEDVTVRNSALRWPVPADLGKQLIGAVIETVERRGKFILVTCRNGRGAGVLILHLGMTGTLRIMERGQQAQKHDHVDIVAGNVVLRFRDARRFGSILWHDLDSGPVEGHPHLVGLGVEPLSAEFAGQAGGELLYRATRGRSLSVKQMLLGGSTVVGVGNIYASESLFRARINPRIACGRIGNARYQALAEAIRLTLAAAIEAGGSTLRDFVGSDGSAGYFQQQYFVYDRVGDPCRVCGVEIRSLRQGQRSTFYCPHCQRR